MRRLGLVMAASTLALYPAAADEAAAFSDALGTAATGVTLAEAYLASCDKYEPESADARHDAFAGWAHKVDLPGYRRLLAGAAGLLPDVIVSLDEQVETARQMVDNDAQNDRSSCTQFKAELAADRFDIERPIRYLLRNAAAFGITIADAPVLPTSDGTEVVPLVVLSAQIAAKMAEVGSKAAAVGDRDLRTARQDRAEAWLAQRPALAIFGRITDKDSLREWRGDQQSTFAARCQSFADDGEAEAMVRDIGQDRIVLGTIRWLRDDRAGGVLSLNDCRILVQDPAEVELADIDDESAGLMVRPPDYEEAYAGPAQGMAMGDIDRVLYAADFSARMDGFGNGYTRRSEDIYVLLRDGTAYRHAWNFAFTDLDVALSRQREPDRWFSWRDDWGKVTLAQTGGIDAGNELDLSSARRLMPAPAELVLDASYYYLNVGMGGGRSDRTYAFAADRTLVHTRSGFVAGNFGTSYIIASGESETASSTYRFDGYTLLIDGADGEERHFVALIDGHSANAPDEVIIDGQVHWRRELAQ